MKIYDCITYCGEELLLKIRLETLYDKIDKFIIVEANRYFNGEKKPQFFNINKFLKFKSKIDFYYIEDLPIYNGSNIEYEVFIKNQIKRGLSDLNPNDIVLISDADEIPNLNNDKFTKFDSAVFLQKMYYYKFNLHAYDGLKWINKVACTKSCKFKFFESVQIVRQFRVRNIPKWRIDRKISRYVEENGGWHFSYLMNDNEISSKLKRFEHEIEHLKRGKNYSFDSLVDINKIKDRVLNFIDPYERSEVKLKKVELDESFPKYIYENKRTLYEYIL